MLMIITVRSHRRAAYCYRRNRVVCLSVCHDREPTKTAEPIEMLLGLWTRVGQGITYQMGSEFRTGMGRFEWGRGGPL